jgi:hypothetical protein
VSKENQAMNDWIRQAAGKPIDAEPEETPADDDKFLQEILKRRLATDGRDGVNSWLRLLRKQGRFGMARGLERILRSEKRVVEPEG